MTISQFEMPILKFFESLHNPVTDKIIIFISSLGDKGFLWIALGVVLLLFRKTRKWGMCVLLALILNFIMVNLCLKLLVARMRPFEFDPTLIPLIAHPGDASFPSGHTSAAFASAIAIFLNDKKSGACALALAILMGISRLYLLVHFPTDVAIGAIVGIIAGYAAGWLLAGRN